MALASRRALARNDRLFQQAEAGLLQLRLFARQNFPAAAAPVSAPFSNSS